MENTLLDSTYVADAYYSSLANDPDLAELVDLFVDEMPDRIHALEQSYSSEDWKQLGCLAHQLKGAAGSYGFSQLTTFAAQLENAVRNNFNQSKVDNTFHILKTACSRVRSGVGR